MARGPRVSATTDVPATALRWDDSVRSCTIPGRDDMVREGTDLRSLSWSRADVTANKACARARKSAPVSDADSVDTVASDSSLGTIASALSCVDHVASAATWPCSKCGGVHGTVSCPSFGDNNRIEHSDGQPCPVPDRTAACRYDPIHGRVVEVPKGSAELSPIEVPYVRLELRSLTS